MKKDPKKKAGKKPEPEKREGLKASKMHAATFGIKADDSAPAKTSAKPAASAQTVRVSATAAKPATKTDMSVGNSIIVRGARTHNLKNISVEMPRNKMIVITGLSGSGKSSLAFDTIFAEGQRRYVESLSSYARQFLRQMQKPDVDEIVGLSPAISIDQKSRSNNPRSTVATITEIYDYLRILFARVGKPHCLECGREIKKLSKEEILQTIFNIVEGNASSTTVAREAVASKKVMGVDLDTRMFKIYAPVVVGRKGEYYQLLYDMLGKGYDEARVDGSVKKLREQIVLSKTKKHDIDILVDQFYISEIKDNSASFRERLNEAVERALHEADGLIRIVVDDGNTEKPMQVTDQLISSKFMCPFDGFSFPEVEPRLFSFNSPHGACPECNGLGTRHFFINDPCPVCKGARLRPEALHVFLKGTVTDAKGNAVEKQTNIVELTALSIAGSLEFFNNLPLNDVDAEIAKVVIKEILARLVFMNDVGIEYLSLNRKANTLSGGEAQRIRLASQLGSGLVGALYVLDEPTIGLHQRDNDRLIKTLIQLRDLGNTLVIVEHDEDTIFAADYIIDIGPGAGVHGGNVIASGWLNDLLTAKTNPTDSVTIDYLRGERVIEIPERRRDENKGWLKVVGGKVNNIENMNVEVPLGRLTTVTGVSGSGKSSFVYEILHKNLLARLDRDHRSANIYNCASFSGTEYLGRTILIDQSPIGRTPRSNPATYTGAWTHIRDMFAETVDARARGWKASRFSFNVKGGRCENCQGNGMIEVEMHFLPTVFVTCDVCNGKRFMKETLEVRYKKKNIYEVLKMTVEEALTFFEDVPSISDRLQTLNEVGLGYLELGQSATTLSGGEAQRVKVSAELYRPHVQKTIYLLDEPTIGLHYEDVRKLIEIMQKLVQKGNTVVVIEHSMDIIKSSDYIIDIGPLGGVGGGKIVAVGTPEEVANHPHSHTGEYLRRVLKQR
ncbi:MAG TPA: excinuclease ABC subunit UvrA [Candidatus Paceibacterota bacterium]